MEDVGKLLSQVSERLENMAKSNAVVARKISVGDRHVLPLCELAMGFGGAGGRGEALEQGANQGQGGAAGGAAKAAPVAVIIVEGGRVRVESLGL